MIERLIKNLREHPILSLFWSLASLSFVFLCHQYYTEDQQIAALRIAAAQVRTKQSELGIVQKLTALHDKALDPRLVAPPATLAEDLKRDFAGAADRMIAQTVGARAELRRSRILLAAPYLENAALKELRDGLARDLEGADAMLAERQELFAMAKDKAPGDMQRQALLQASDRIEARVMEGEARFVAGEQIFNGVRDQYNAAAAGYNAERRMYFARSNLTIIAGAYLGGFAGAIIGYFLYRRRRARQQAGHARAQPDEAPAANKQTARPRKPDEPAAAAMSKKTARPGGPDKPAH